MIGDIWDTVQSILDSATAIGLTISFVVLLVAGAYAAFAALTR